MTFLSRRFAPAFVALLFSGILLLSGCEGVDDTGAPMDDEQQQQ